ncbi:hypothetical protein JYU34_019981 [Plutella xylostella]|uniref:Uncharacterized protein n=2 Tax=Plutella xylostella TaxID=51655 RepID=A0ABQ7PWA0_PLUXY|nr:two pore potassium channel protein sup-9 [Plutella xylostella]KAG7297048.1 hypothetical protein JYU34_019981 [Plutella xylostella]CAG9109073.1 unnamed protein product [Plutella xylostella]
MKKQNVRTLSLIVCTFTYLLVGAAVFDALESTTERNRFEVLQAIEGMIIRKYNITEEDFRVMETVVLKSEPHKAGQQWKFTGAFYYATTVLTTIGYGHSTPSTIGGKLFTMFYAIVGIPLGLIMFQSIGERVNRLSSVIIKSIKRALNCKQTSASEVDLICVVTTLSSLTIAGGAAAFSKFEGWSYFDSVYYCFITLTTIGFGDMVALQKDNALNRKPSYVMFALIFILFGLAIVAACLNLLVLRFVTMNTEDEKRDQRMQEQAQQVAVRLEGDVITADGAVLRGVSRGTRLPAPPCHAQGDTSMIPLYMDDEYPPSVCSCSCSCFGPNRSIPYRDPLSPVPPTNIRAIRARNSTTRELGGLPRYIEKSSAKNRSQTLRLNSASGYLYMNAKTNDFQLNPADFREIINKRREQLRKGIMMYEMQSHDRYSCRNSVSTRQESPHSSFYSMNLRCENEKRSIDPLMDDFESEKSSYARKKIRKNIDRNTRKENYFYDDAVLHFDDEYAFDGSILFAKRRKSLTNWDDYTCEMPNENRPHCSTDQVSNDGSYGYYLNPEEEESQYFVNDTLTFVPPPHRASI